MKTKVLIIGAGPTGLMAACQLKRFGIDALIVDAKEGPTTESRALVLHARSLEIYEQLGIAAAAVQEGAVAAKVQFIIKDKKAQEARLGVMGAGLSQFPFLLLLEQSKNEKLLYGYLKKSGGDVLWQTEMLSIRQEAAACYVAVSTKENRFTIEADWVIAADGAKSTTRHCLHLPFEGSTYEQVFYVADTKLSWPWGHGAISIYLSGKTFMGLFPMQGSDRFRVIGMLPPAYQNEHPARFDTLVPFIQQQVPVPLAFRETTWFSVYRLHHRCLAGFRNGRVFFAGDAAHVHSPVGGQGMNTGLQDASNLAWKLAYAIQGFAGEKILNTYNEERLPFAKQLVATTDRAFSVITSGKWRYRFLRLYVFPLAVSVLFRLNRFRKIAFKKLSQTGITYYRSRLSQQHLSYALAVKAGDRFPYVRTRENKTVYELMPATRFYVLLFYSTNKKAAAERTALQQMFPFVSVLDLSADTNIRAALHIKGNTVIVVRPDQYIGFITDGGMETVQAYFRQLAG